MKRSATSSAPACPTYFTPLQIHARELLQLGVTAWVGWMRDHTVSIQKMIEQYSASVVVAGANLQYFENCSFHDGDTIELNSTSVVHKKGVLIEGVTHFVCGGKNVAEMSIFLRPVIIGDENSSAAKAGHLLPEIQNLFKPGEFSEVPYSRYVKQLLPKIEQEGLFLAQGSFPFKLYRYAMDFADQWAFMETAAYVSASREELSVSQADKHPRLIEGVSCALKNYYLDLKRPYFLFDNGEVDTKAYLWNDNVVFVHNLQSNVRGEKILHAVVIEEMHS